MEQSIRNLAIAVIVTSIGIAILAISTPTYSDVMRVCQLSHSFDTCHNAMNR